MSDAEAEAAVAPRCYRHPDRETWVSCQRCGRAICPSCQTQAAVGVQCPECVREGHGTVRRRAPRWLAALGPGRATVVTYVLIGLNLIFYALQWLTAHQLTEAWYLFPYSIGSEPWRLLTSAFLHSPNISHLLFNMFALFIFGPVLESFIGRLRFTALYLIGALGGSLGVLTAVEVWIFADGTVQNAPAGALGASGAVFALMGAVFALRRAMGIDVRQLLFVLAINLALPFFIGGIAWQGHIGGLIIGFLIGTILARTRRPEARIKQIVGLAAVAGGLLLLFVAYLVSAPIVYF